MYIVKREEADQLLWIINWLMINSERTGNSSFTAFWLVTSDQIHHSVCYEVIIQMLGYHKCCPQRVPELISKQHDKMDVCINWLQTNHHQAMVWGQGHPAYQKANYGIVHPFLPYNVSKLFCKEIIATTRGICYWSSWSARPWWIWKCIMRFCDKKVLSATWKRPNQVALCVIFFHINEYWVLSCITCCTILSAKCLTSHLLDHIWHLVITTSSWTWNIGDIPVDWWWWRAAI